MVKSFKGQSLQLVIFEVQQREPSKEANPVSQLLHFVRSLSQALHPEILFMQHLPESKFFPVMQLLQTFGDNARQSLQSVSVEEQQISLLKLKNFPGVQVLHFEVSSP